jgi:hypothetical protein
MAARWIAALSLALCCTPALAAYKCEINGKTTYSDEPCPGGKQIDLKNTPGGSISDEDRQRALKQSAHDKAELARLEKENDKRDAARAKEQKKTGAAQDKMRKKCANLTMRKKWAEDDAAASVGKSSEKAKKKARRLAEQYVVECKQ